MRNVILKLIGWILSLAMMGILFLCIGFLYLESKLPDVESLNDIKLQVPLRIYSSDGKLIAEYGEKRRLPVKLSDIPKPLINGLLATEDQRFYEHPGVDVLGLGRAAIQLIRTGVKTQGGSTITMQVARNFFLNNKKTFIRKINEILLAVEIDHKLSKEKILELYLNEIYLGNRAYGVGAAAHVYYGVDLKDLTLGQMAMIAGLPKAPSTINPIANPKAAKLRRNHVLQRMLEEKFITRDQYNNAVKEPIFTTYHGPRIDAPAPHVAEMIREALFARYGNDAYTNGYSVYTTVDSRLQNAAENAVINGLDNYDQRHGYRGPVKNIGQAALQQEHAAHEALADITPIHNALPALVMAVSDKSAAITLADETPITLNWSGLEWARPQLPSGYMGAQPQSALQILKPGDIIYVTQDAAHNWRLTQIPEVEGALVSLDPKDGAIKAIVGGYSFGKSSFNRAAQSMRQPGSSFKPFIYSAALSKGFTLASVINDAPIAVNDPSQEDLWRPQNDNHRFNGPTRLRDALVHSRNLVSIRLLNVVGISYVVDFLQRFGFNKESLPASLSLALGTLETSPLQLADAFAVFANTGYKVEPYVIDHINDNSNKVIFKAHPKVACPSCAIDSDLSEIPEAQQAPRVLSPQIVYLMTSAMKDVILEGTATAARVLNRADIAGKTGTTNDQNDGWFAGFNSSLVCVVWVGYDQPQSLHEYGNTTALPIWIDFMRNALAGKPLSSMPEPPGIVSVRIDPRTGLLASPSQQSAIFEMFNRENVPSQNAPADDGSPIPPPTPGDEDPDELHIF